MTNLLSLIVPRKEEELNFGEDGNCGMGLEVAMGA